MFSLDGEGEQLLFVGTVGPRLGFPTSPMVGAKFFSLPVSLERLLCNVFNGSPSPSASRILSRSLSRVYVGLHED